MHTPNYKYKSESYSIKLLRTELEYDIDFTANRVAKINFKEDIKTARNVTTEGKENMDWIDDTIMLAMSNLSHKLRFCHVNHSRLSTDETKTKDSEDEGTMFIMALRLPDWKGDAETLARLIHSYVVYFVLSEWFDMTVPQIAEKFLIKAKDAMKHIVQEARSSDVSPIYSNL